MERLHVEVLLTAIHHAFIAWSCWPLPALEFFYTSELREMRANSQELSYSDSIHGEYDTTVRCMRRSKPVWWATGGGQVGGKLQLTR